MKSCKTRNASIAQIPILSGLLSGQLPSDREYHTHTDNETLSFAVFLCLQCAGVHRGFGVHVRCVLSSQDRGFMYLSPIATHLSFVRSVSMDTWQEEQIKRMQASLVLWR